jgi:hypothetical protein
MTAQSLILVAAVLIGVLALIVASAKMLRFTGWQFSGWRFGGWPADDHPVGGVGGDPTGGTSIARRQFNRWRTRPRVARTLILRESIALDARRRIHLVQCGERQVVVLTGGSQDLIIGWMQDP